MNQYIIWVWTFWSFWKIVYENKKMIKNGPFTIQNIQKMEAIWVPMPESMSRHIMVYTGGPLYSRFHILKLNQPWAGYIQKTCILEYLELLYPQEGPGTNFPWEPRSDCTYNRILFSHKRNGVLIQAIMSMKFQSVLSERSQTQQITYCMLRFIWNIISRIRKSMETENILMIARVRRRRGWGVITFWV